MAELEKIGLIFPEDFEEQFESRVKLFEEEDIKQLESLLGMLLFHQNPNNEEILKAYKKLASGPKRVADWIFSFFTSNK